MAFAVDDFHDLVALLGRRTEEHLARLDTRVGLLQRDSLERRFRERPHAYLGRYLRRVHVLTEQELVQLVEDAVDEGRLTETERLDLLNADLIARGRRPDDGTEVYVVGEVSVGVGMDDVKRAAHRAAVLAKLRPALPLVGGEWLTPDARALADELGAWQVLDGQVSGPRP